LAGEGQCLKPLFRLASAGNGIAAPPFGP